MNKGLLNNERGSSAFFVKVVKGDINNAQQ